MSAVPGPRITVGVNSVSLIPVAAADRSVPRRAGDDEALRIRPGWSARRHLCRRARRSPHRPERPRPAASLVKPATRRAAYYWLSASRVLRRDYQLRLRDDGGELAVVAHDLGLPDHGGAAAMQRRAFGARGVADRDGGEKIGLALDRHRPRTLRQVRDRAGAAQGVRKRHDGAAVHYAGTVGELRARGECRLHALFRTGAELQPDELHEAGRVAVEKFTYLFNRHRVAFSCFC